MLRHSASAVCLVSPDRSYTVGPRTLSTVHFNNEESRKTNRFYISKRSSSFTRLGISDEETCTTSDAGCISHACVNPAASTLVSRRPSTEAFEDAVDHLEEDESHTSDFGACYSSFAFNIRDGVMPTKFGTSTCSKELNVNAASRMSHPASRFASSSSRFKNSVVRSYAPALRRDETRNGSASLDRLQGAKPFDSAQDADTASSNTVSTKQTSEKHDDGQRPKTPKREERNSRDHTQRNNVSSLSEERSQNRLLLSKSASKELPDAVPRRKLINRYSSVPAFTAADKLRMEQFKEGLPLSVSTQEALRLHAKERKKHEHLLRPSSFERTTDLMEPVDWRSLLNAAGLTDVAEEEIKIEAEELQAKIDAYAPQGRLSWCGSLLSCFWAMTTSTRNRK